ncbi:hypothetical protein GGR52DRAFT_575147 [Hypoxylon sp. FL1284]|nr:hypothetical protein GGR52DRAFT_575147 [Hypoxylon sp. FL1284]
MDQHRDQAISDERSNLSKPQIFVQLAFGVSWTQRHTPQTHTLTYMSRNLKNARDSGNFPRQLPAPNTNFLNVPEQEQQQRQHRNRGQAARQHQHQHQHQHRQQNRPNYHSQQSHAPAQPRDHGHPRFQTNDQPSCEERAGPRRDSRSESRAAVHERGRSAPPPFNDSPWDVHHASTSTLSPQRESGEQSQMWKALPAPPSQYRLGEDGLPWSAWAWPWPANTPDSDTNGGESPFANHPTTVPLSTDQPRNEDPDRVRELESLSTAMMTVDNGFENQWWYQGSRESVDTWLPQDTDEEDEVEDARTVTTADALAFSSLEPPSALEYTNGSPASFHMVSPISDASSPAQSFRSPLHRSLTTRSEELWLGS